MVILLGLFRMAVEHVPKTVEHVEIVQITPIPDKIGMPKFVTLPTGNAPPEQVVVIPQAVEQRLLQDFLLVLLTASR